QWRTDEGFANGDKAFHVQPNAGTEPDSPCSDDRTTWTFYTFPGWQGIGEDLQKVVQNPGFNNPAYPVDDYSPQHGSLTWDSWFSMQRGRAVEFRAQTGCWSLREAGTHRTNP